MKQIFKKLNKLSLPITIIVASFVLGSFFFASQVNKQRSIERQQQVEINESTEIKEIDYFQKKVDCEKYIDKISRQIIQYNNSKKPERLSQVNTLSFDDPNQTYGLYLHSKELKDFFYSPKLDTCLYVEIRRTSLKTKGYSEFNGDIEWWKPIYETYYLIDALNSKEIEFNNDLPFLQVLHRGENFTSQKDAEDIINKYK